MIWLLLLILAFFAAFVWLIILLIQKLISKPKETSHYSKPKPSAAQSPIAPKISVPKIFLNGAVSVLGKTATIKFNRSVRTEGRFLVIDTETTGLPHIKDAPSTDIDNWPRVVSISWLLFDADYKLIDSYYSIVKQQKLIPVGATRIHGITNEIAERDGAEPNEVFQKFQQALANTKYVVSHNIDFDAPIIEAEMIRHGIKGRIKKKDRICTMRRGTRLMKELYGDTKWPKLEELFYTLFGAEMSEDAHNARVDTTHAAACFFQLVEEDYIKIE